MEQRLNETSLDCEKPNFVAFHNRNICVAPLPPHFTSAYLSLKSHATTDILSFSRE